MKIPFGRFSEIGIPHLKNRLREIPNIPKTPPIQSHKSFNDVEIRGIEDHENVEESLRIKWITRLDGLHHLALCAFWRIAISLPKYGWNPLHTQLSVYGELWDKEFSSPENSSKRKKHSYSYFAFPTAKRAEKERCREKRAIKFYKSEVS